MGISILEELDNLAASTQASGFQTAFLVTYNVNLHFFEQLVMPKLARIGVSHIGVLADRQAYQASLSEPIGAEQCGKSYVMGYCPWLRSLQHGKLLWLHGDQDIVFIGSHNLTRSGFNDSLETTVRLDSGDPAQLAAVKSAHGAVSALVEGADALSRIWRLIPEPIAIDSELTTHFLWSGHGGLLDQLTEVIGPAQELRVVTPFLDASALRKLALAFSASRVILDLPSDGADTPLDEALAVVSNLTARTVNKPNHLHGKAYQLTTEDSLWLAIGSANCTNAGIVKGIAEGGNSEFLAVLESEPLEDERVEFRIVEDPSQFAGTGRRWDEGDIRHISGINYFSAMYEDEILTTVWEPCPLLSKPHLTAGNDKYELDKSPSKVPMLEDPPRSVTLSGRLGGKDVSADAWVVFFNEIALHASGISTRRRRTYLESDDPIEQAYAIELEVVQLLRALRLSNGDGIRVTAREGQHLRDEEVEQAITAFEFSPDLDEITRRAVSLIVGDHSTDPLAMIRGLIARITGPIPKDHRTDERSIEDYNSRREKASRRIADVLISHLKSLSRIDNDEWLIAPDERVRLCLQATFEVVVLLWWKALYRDSRNFQRFTQAMLDFIRVLDSSERQKSLCTNTEVAGPCVLAVAAAGEAASNENERDSLRRFLRSLFSNNYGAVVEEWSNAHHARSTMIVKFRGEHGEYIGLDHRLRSAHRLMGAADESIVSKQEQKYGTLLRYIEALKRGEPTVESFFREAESEWHDTPLWQRCVEARRAGMIPNIVRVAKPVCGNCFMSLPAKHQHDLERGEIVVCPECGTMLIFGLQCDGRSERRHPAG